MNIRPYQPVDRQSVIALMRTFNQYIASIDDKQRADYKEESSEYFTNKMIQLAETKHGAIFVACDNDEVIGFISGYVDEQDDDEKMETIPAVPGVIGELFVLDQYRGQGIGEQLMQKIEQYLEEKGCTIIRFPVFAPNTIARHFYDKAGYTERLITVMKELTLK